MLPSPSPSPWTGRLEKQVEGKRGSQTRSFRFVLLVGLNRGFFTGTVVEGDMDALLAKDRSSGTEGVVQTESSK